MLQIEKCKLFSAVSSSLRNPSKISSAFGSRRAAIFIRLPRSPAFLNVANCNASCYWLQVHCSQWQLLLFFSSKITIAFVAIWKFSCGELGYCLTRCTNPELVAKCEQILWMTSCELNEGAAKPKAVARS